MDDVIEGILNTERGLVVAAAGCGKTELLARTVANTRAGRQLVLTHTHAGVAALKRRFDKLRVPHDRYRLDTIAGWTLRYASAYPALSGLGLPADGTQDWPDVYAAAQRVLAASLGRRVVAASYDGVLVDEYQDCSAAQHRIVQLLATALPVRVVGDPLQAIFGFRADDPVVNWADVTSFFTPLPELVRPWRWLSTNRRLGDWLTEARAELLATQRLTISRGAPADWVSWSREAELDCCRAWTPRTRRDRVLALKKWPRGRAGAAGCLEIATLLGGRFQLVETFDDRALPSMAEFWMSASGAEVLSTLHSYVRDRMIKVGPELTCLIEAIARGRSTARFRKHLDHRDRLVRLAQEPTPDRALAVLDGFRGQRGWVVYRPDGIYQLRTALQECAGKGMSAVADAVTAVRTRARHRGRIVPLRALGTALLVKGLEFEDAIVLNADELSCNELYVAITRGSRSLKVLSRDSTVTAT